MKYYAIAFLFVVSCTPQQKNTTSSYPMEKVNSDQVSSDSMQSLFLYARDNQVLNPFPVEKVLLGDGQYALIATSDNIKTKSILINYPKITPFQFLRGLTNIEGEITMYGSFKAKDWINKSQVDSLLQIVGSTVTTPTIAQFSMDFQFPPDEIFAIKFKTRGNTYLKLPMGHNALCMINGYFTGFYPSSNYQSAEKLKALLEAEK